MTGTDQKLISVHRWDLIQALYIEMAYYLDHASEDLLRMEAFEEICKEHFADLSMIRVEDAVSPWDQLGRKRRPKRQSILQVIRRQVPMLMAALE